MTSWRRPAGRPQELAGTRSTSPGEVPFRSCSGGDRSAGGGCMVGAGPKWSAGCALQGLTGNHLKCVAKSLEGFRQRGDTGTFAFSESLWLLSGCQTSGIRSGHREGWGGGGWHPGGWGGGLDHEGWWDTEEGRDSSQPCPDLRVPHAQAHVETWLSQFPSVRSDRPPPWLWSGTFRYPHCCKKGMALQHTALFRPKLQ